MRDTSAGFAEAAAQSFGRESDPVLAAQAMPFALKTLDMLALQHPDNAAIQLAAAKAYIQYSAAFLDWEARKLEAEHYNEAATLRRRAARLYFRGRDYALTALELSMPGSRTYLAKQPQEMLHRATATDAAILYWLGAGWAAGIATDPSNLNEVAALPVIESIMQRALELDADYGEGAIAEFFILYEGSRSAAAGGNPERAEMFFEQAVAASRGKLASPYVALATSLMIQRQDRHRFRALLEQALTIDPDGHPEHRLANMIARDKARWYLDHTDYFFLTDVEPEAP